MSGYGYGGYGGCCGYGYGGWGYGCGFVLIVVLFILLIIVGATVCY
ncbi:YjcZ family sporulation protein [Neobacillus cucumis]|uniref:Sporulation protein YjcZ n=1 Tax=Neobacillus cucumis TaxID=1740721 RepID=A0A2N5HMZ8_9BACI|nr:YjcZ family sporulation protein [Neobacillus cucumis]PLS06905.1 sporulation protein YjcZ [Neobacillus cucumis]